MKFESSRFLIRLLFLSNLHFLFGQWFQNVKNLSGPKKQQQLISAKKKHLQNAGDLVVFTFFRRLI